MSAINDEAHRGMRGNDAGRATTIMQKCLHWETFCREQHHWMVKPVFVVQVLNGAGGNLSETPFNLSKKLFYPDFLIVRTTPAVTTM